MPDLIIPSDGDPLTGLLLRAAADPSFDVQKFEAVMRFMSEREDKMAERAFNAAMSRAQGDLRAVFRDRANEHLRTRYATLDAMLAVVLPAINTHGLSVRFETEPSGDPAIMRMFIVISHDDGHVSRRSMDGPITALGAQGGRTQMTAMQTVGSTATYLSRYLLRMAFAIQVTDDDTDDDGEAQRQAPPPREPTNGAPKQEATAPIDHEGYKAAFRRRLHQAKDQVEITALLAIPDLKAWLDAAPLRIKADVDAMVVAKQKILAEAAAPAMEPAMAPAMIGLLERIENATEAELDAMLDTASFNDALKSLPFPAQDRVDMAFKARAAKLKEEKDAKSD